MKPTVLVVDDEPQNIELAYIVLQKEGYRLLHAQNGEEALEILNGHDVHVMVLDLMMPKLNGFELLERIKREEALHSIPVLVVTALGEEESRERAMKLGADAYLVKPYDIIDLKMRVKAMFKIGEGIGAAPKNVVKTWFNTIDEWMDPGVKRHILATMLKHLESDDEALLNAAYRFVYACGTEDLEILENREVADVIATKRYDKTPMDDDPCAYLLRRFNVALVRYRASMLGINADLLLKGTPDRYFLAKELNWPLKAVSPS